MHKEIFSTLLLFLTVATFCQETNVKSDTIVVEKAKKFDVSFLVINRYIWRGQCFGGNNITIQPEINYAISKKISVGLWASTNFKNDYYFLDGTTGNGYQEIDLNISYQINKFLKVQLSDYYWPTVEKIEGTNNGYFNYGNNSVKTLDATLIFDFSDIWKPIKTTLSTFLSGNDFKYNADGENPKQNFTTYVESSYVFENILKKTSKKIFKNIDFEPVVGVVLNNKAQYYVAGDYNKPTFVNLGLKISKDFEIDKHFKLLIYFNFIHNAATQNTTQFGKNFLVFGVKLSYK